MAVVSLKIPRRLKEKMRAIDIKWNEVLRKAKEAKIEEHERRKAVADFMEFRAKNKIPKNKTRYTSETLIRRNREER